MDHLRYDQRTFSHYESFNRKRNADRLLCAEETYGTVSIMSGAGDELEAMPGFFFPLRVTSCRRSSRLTERHLPFLFGCGLMSSDVFVFLLIVVEISHQTMLQSNYVICSVNDISHSFVLGFFVHGQ